MLLTGWKEIAKYLRCGVRTAQRRERNGLPVQRPVPGDRSPVYAESAAIDAWLHRGRLRRIANDELLANMEKATKLREEVQRARKKVQQAREDLHLKMDALKKEIMALRGRHRRDQSLL